MSEMWKNLVRTVLADPSPETAAQTEVALQWIAPWAAWITIAIVLASILFFTTIYRRENQRRDWIQWVGLLLLRLSMIAMVLFMLYGLRQQPYQTDAPDLVVAIDDSQSMSHLDEFPDGDGSLIRTRVEAAGYPSPTRWNQSRTLLLEKNQQFLNQLDERYNVQPYWIGESGRSIPGNLEELPILLDTSEPIGASSRLGESVSQILEQQRGRPTAAVVLLTDGISIEGTALEEAAQQAALRGIPLFPIGIGSQKDLRDLAIDEVVVDPVAFVGDTLTFTIRVSGKAMDGEKVRISVVDSVNDSEVLDEQTIVLPSQRAAREIRLKIRPEKTGTFEYQVRAETSVDELTLDNNQVTRRVKVLDATIRVLYVQAYPRYQFRFLKMLLERQLKRAPNGSGSEKAFQLTTVLQDSDQAYADQDETAAPTFPATREELFSYDVVILGDVNAAFLNREQLQNLQEFVQVKGGGLMMVAGQYFMPWDYRSTPLASLFPFELDDVTPVESGQVFVESQRLDLTDLGLGTLPLQVSPITSDTLKAWQSFDKLRWYAPVEKTKPAAQILAEVVSNDGERQPLLTQQFVGRGKVMFLTSDDLWSWDYHDEFWMQSIRYLARSSLLDSDGLVELTVDRTTYRAGDSATARVRFFDEGQAPVADDGVQLTLEKPDGRTKSVTMSRVASQRELFQASLPGLTVGEHRLWIVQPVLAGKDGQTEPPTVRFIVEATEGELTRLDMDVASMKNAASQSQGKYLSFLEAEQLLELLPSGRQVRIQTLPPQPLWNSWKLALLFVTLLIGEWLLRKRAGLL